jgi:YfiH family protein
VHGFSTRTGGFSRVYGDRDLNLGFTKDDSPSTVDRNRAAFLREVLAGSGNAHISFSPSILVTLRQIHSDIIHCVDSAPTQTLTGDGLLTATSGPLLAIQIADCLPIILADSKRRAVGIFHAGWRGTIQRIVEKGVGEMQRWFSSAPRDLKAAIGPGIHACCYEVGEDVREKFDTQFGYASGLFREVKEADPIREKYPLLFLSARPPGHSIQTRKFLLDLVEANRRQLLDAGVPAKRIEASPLCTQCQTDLLFSYRAENGRTGRMMAVAGIKG